MTRFAMHAAGIFADDGIFNLLYTQCIGRLVPGRRGAPRAATG